DGRGSSRCRLRSARGGSRGVASSAPSPVEPARGSPARAPRGRRRTARSCPGRCRRSSPSRARPAPRSPGPWRPRSRAPRTHARRPRRCAGDRRWCGPFALLPGGGAARGNALALEKLVDKSILRIAIRHIESETRPAGEGANMEFGIFSQMHVPPWDDEHSRYLLEIEVALAVEAAGFKYDWSPEHHFLQHYSHQPAPEVFLSWVGART